MGDAVDLDQMVAALRRGDDRERSVPPIASRLRASPEPFDVDDRDRRRRARSRTGRGRDAADDDSVRLATVAQLDLAADLRVDVRAAAARPAEEAPPDRAPACSSPASSAAATRPTSAQARRQVLVGRGQPVEPRRVDRAGA